MGIAKLVFFLMVLVLCSASMCDEPAECEPNAMRCNKNTLEICNPSGAWVTHTDCGKVESEGGKAWVCVPASTEAEEATCQSQE